MKRGIAIAAMVLLAGSAYVPAGAQAPGEIVYKQKCAMCHGADGEGNTPAGKMMKVTSLKSPDIVKESNPQLIEVTKKGKGKMPEFGTKLTDKQIMDVVAYIRTLQKK